MKASMIKRRTNGCHAAIHHIAGRDNVDASARLSDCHFGQNLKRWVVDDLTGENQAVVTVD
jgi:hypothetical protein